MLKLLLRLFGALTLAAATPALAACPAQFITTTIAVDAQCIFRDYQTEGVPASGTWAPWKSDIRAWAAQIGGAVSQLQGSLAGGSWGYSTLSALNADLAHPAGSIGTVFSDGSNNGVYLKSGASGSGSWSRVSTSIYALAPTFSIGGVTSLSAGTAPTVTLGGSTAAPTLTFGFGPPNLSIGTVTTRSSGSSATAAVRGTGLAPILDLGIPTGATPAFSMGTVTTVPYGASPTASISGSSLNPTLNLGLPTGPSGALRWRGAWSGSNTYALNDLVSSSGSVYVANNASPTGTPGVSGSWDVFVTPSGATTPPLATSALNLYVATGANGGNNSNDCLAATVGGGHGPCLTINYATQVALKYDAGNNPITVNIGAGTFNECVAVNNPLRGSANTTPNPQSGGYGSGELLYSGAGSASTFWTGCSSFCYTLAASNHADVGLRNMTVQGVGAACQSSIFVQLAAIVNLHEGLTLASASQEIIHVENAGSSVQVWGNVTVTGSGSSLVGFSDGAEVIDAAYPGGVFTLTGTPGYATAVIFGRSGARMQWNAPNLFSGAATGQAFLLRSNAVLEIPGSDIASLPGSTIGSVSGGAVVRSSSFASVLSTGGAIGSTGTASVLANAKPEAGYINIQPSGSAIGSYAIVNIALPYRIETDGGAEAACQATLSQRSGTFAAGAIVQADYQRGYTALTDLLKLNVSNFATNFSAGGQYVVSYSCQGY